MFKSDWIITGMTKGGAGKRKGSQFERVICKRLSLWVTKGEREDVFWRSAASGGRATVHAKRGVDIRQGGDICAVAPEGHVLCDIWFIELKHYRDLNIASFFLCNKGKLAKFWKTAKEQALRHNRQPWLIAKQNNTPTLALLVQRLENIEPVATTNNAHVYLFDAILKLEFSGDRSNHS